MRKPRTQAENGGSKIRITRFDRKKEEILHAAGALFNRHGLRDATLAVIADDIGLHLKSLRYYFERREDLVAAAFARSIELHRQLAEDALAEHGLEARIRRFVRDYFALLAAVKSGDQPEFVYFGDLRSLTPPHSDIVWAAYSDMFRAIRRLFLLPDLIWPRPRINALTHMLLSQLLWSVVWAPDYFPEDTAILARRFCDILLYGIASAPIDLGRFSVSQETPTNESSGLSQNTFLRTATSLINQIGYRGASVDRISAELSVTKGAFYHYNDTRDSLVIACFEHSFRHLRNAQNAALETEATGLLQIAHATISLVTRQMLDSGTLLRTSALTAIGPELRLQMARKIANSTRRFGDMLNDGLIDRSVRPCNLRIASEMTSAMINSAEELQRWVRSATAENAPEIYVGPFLFGILSA